jgi:alkyl hydroperoxide reductase subunit AhpC
MRSIHLVSLILAGGLLLAGCGGGDAPSATKPQAPAPRAAAASAGKLKLGDKLPTFTLPIYGDESGATLDTASLFDGESMVAVMFYSPACPCVVNCFNAMAETMPAADYPDLKIVGVMSDKQHDFEWMVNDFHAQAESGLLTFPVVLDADQAILKQFGATRTPEVWLADREGRIRFWGAPESTIEPTSTGHRFLMKEAVDALRAGKEPPVTAFPPVGCLISVGA